MKKDKLFEQNILPSYQAVLKYLYAQTRDPILSEDLTQETMRSAWEKLDQVKRPQSYKNWVMQISHNVLLSHYRAEGAEKRGGSEGGLLNIDDLEILDVKAGDAVDELIDQEAILELFVDLAQTHREIISLHLFLGFTFDDVAQILNMNSSTVRVYYRRGLKQVEKNYYCKQRRESEVGRHE
ncbi:RNA polymerase sigma factor [Anaerovorax odorimutans]|uniref:RNA polymerase sigma factor n=1 Tax=Anaerovorax odorimutans TaxID=109327 RepID=A0ABT1RK23_9FIRM|nr:RNA polymerase sigma factor [Anaerovorax odorimutans]MCQ4635528.1 RNA polymerase sigma factor [Anaerovorax odorimutans]